jgi:LPXTG-motif cell wall-anchored protein
VIHVPERVTLDISASVDDTVVQQVTLTRDCSKPSASISLACSDGGGAAVVLRNDGVGAVDFFIDKNMATFGGPYAVLGGTSQRVVIPLAAREFAEVTVSTGDGVVVADQVVIHDCSVPAVVSIAVSCPEGGAAVVVSNSGTEPATFRFTKNGAPVGGDVEVAAGGTGRVVIAMTEDETATIGVETAAGALAAQSVTRDCAQVAGIKITTTSSTTTGAVLPVTGSDTGPLVVLAGVLLLAGAALLALSARAQRTT